MNGKEQPNNWIHPRMEVSLALGGGGAKGNCHIGVLRVLDALGVQVRAIAGTSAGGLVGALYAAGVSPLEIQKRMSKVDQASLYGRRPQDGPALLGVAGVFEFLHDLIGERTFDDLCIPFAVTAVDIHNGRLIYLRTGRVLDALLATIAIPGIFPPREVGQALLVDGGVLDPVPVRLARLLAPDAPVAAVVLSDLLDSPVADALPFSIPAPEPLLRQIARLRVAQAFSLFTQSVEVTSRAIAEMRLEIDRPEIVIRPRVGTIGLLDQVDVAHLAEEGALAAWDQLNTIRQHNDWAHRLNRWLRQQHLPQLPLDESETHPHD